jgi:hypothetical protein
MAEKTNQSEMVWHNDGHYIVLRISRSELEVVEVGCNNGDGGICYERDYGCLVQWFLTRYGMECNAGVCPAEEKIEICWTILGDRRNLDVAQVWFMPKTDDTFKAWLISNT